MKSYLNVSYLALLMTKVGVVGLGKWGMNHLRLYKELDCELVGIADTDKSKEKIATENNVKFFTDYKELFPLVDAISIVTPTNTHHQIIKDCLNAGKHVYAEKPITLNHKEAEGLIELAKKKNLILNVGYLYRFNSSVRELKRYMKNIGDIHYIKARYTHSTNPPRTDVGAMFNLGIHLVDILNFVLEKKPLKIYAKKHNYLSKELEECASILLDYGKFYANLELSSLHPDKKRDMWIFGSKQKVYVDFFDQILKIYPLEIEYDKIKRSPEINVEIYKNEPLKDSLNNFLNTTRGNIFYNFGEEEIFTTKLCELGLKSAELGKEIDLNDKEYL